MIVFVEHASEARWHDHERARCRVTASRALDMLDEVDAPNVVVHLDTYHMNIEESDFMQPVLACGKRLGCVHIGESNRGYLGSGTIDFAQFFHALAIRRNLWEDSMDLATHARAFMAGGINAAAKAKAHH